MQDRRWTEKFQVFEKEKPAKLEFCDAIKLPLKVRRNQTFSDKQKLREFVSRLGLHGIMLKSDIMLPMEAL